MGKTSAKLEPYLTELEPYLIEAENQYKASPYFAIRADYYEARQSCEIDDHMILYEAFYGRGITCNPGALFRYLLSDARFSDYTHVWVLEESADRDRIIAEFADKANVRFVEPFTNDYLKYLSTAKYLINNSTWPNYFSKKEGQVVINTWHGIPLKSLYYDIPGANIIMPMWSATFC